MPARILDGVAIRDQIKAECGPRVERFSARASVITGPERERIYAAHAADFPGFAEYQEKTDRIIPVVELERL